MKKTLILTMLMVAMLISIFAISVSAAGSTSNEFAQTPDTIDGVSAPLTIGTAERVVLLGALRLTDKARYVYGAFRSLRLGDR